MRSAVFDADNMGLETKCYKKKVMAFGEMYIFMACIHFPLREDACNKRGACKIVKNDLEIFFFTLLYKQNSSW